MSSDPAVRRPRVPPPPPPFASRALPRASLQEASTYLARTNFKSVIEWLTAEAILNRPDDPLTFVRDLVDLKLHECGAAASEKTRASSDVFS